MINFLAELSARFEHEIHLTPSNTNNRGFTRKNNIYEIDINEVPEGSYWEDWGGTFDNFQGTQIEIYLGQFLERVYSLSSLLATPNSIYVQNSLIVMVNIPKHPWLYSDEATQAYYVNCFLHSALNPDKPSMNVIKGYNAQTRLALPNLNTKLSENINGIALNQGFSVSFVNNDGYFDDESKWNIHNSPLRIKKTLVDNPNYDDFKDIRVGLVENTITNFENFQVDVSDKYRSMDNPVCDIITKERFENIVLDDNTLNKNIPILYGQKKVKLQKLNATNYIAAEYISQVIGVYDSNGISLNYTFNTETMIITSSGNPDSAIIKGYTKNKIGEIIKDLVTRKAGITYSNANWNDIELERYLDSSPRVNIIIESGSVKTAIQTVLKNDVAYFIQQNDGRFTIRKYGSEYETHIISPWVTTKKPEKTWGTAQDNFFSSCIINYDFTDRDTYKSLLYDERAVEAEGNYRRKINRIFDTELTNEKEARELAEVLADRYATMMQTVKLPVGIDTSSFELLDRVLCTVGINGRQFSRGEYFFIKEIDPAQDILVLEEFNLLDITGEYYNTTAYAYDIDHLYAYTSNEDYEYIFDGGIQ